MANTKKIHAELLCLFLCLIFYVSSSVMVSAAPEDEITIDELSPHYTFTNLSFPLNAEAEISGGIEPLSQQWCLQYPGNSSWIEVSDNEVLSDYSILKHPDGSFPGLATLKFIANTGSPADCDVTSGDPERFATINTQVYLKNNTPICDASPEIIKIRRGEALAACVAAPSYDATSEYSYTQEAYDPDDYKNTPLYDLAYKWILYEKVGVAPWQLVAEFDDTEEIGCFNLSSQQTLDMDLDKLYKIEFRASDCGVNFEDCNTAPDELPYCKDTLFIEIENQAPHIMVSPQSTKILKGETKQFTGEITDPEDDYNLNYEWLLDANSQNSGSVTQLVTTPNNLTVPTNLTRGSHTVALNAQDLSGQGALSEFRASLNVINHPPIGVALSPKYTESYVGEAISFSATASDPDGDTLSYSMYALDSLDQSLGTPFCTSSTCSYTSSVIGTKYIALKVDDGSDQIIDYAELLVKNTSPSVHIEYSGTPALNTALTLSAVTIDQDAGSILPTHTWYKEGIPIFACQNLVTNTCTINEAVAGVYSYTVEVNDGSAASSEPAIGSASRSISFLNNTPQATIETSGSQIFSRAKIVTAGETFSLSGGAVDADGPSTLAFVWKLDGTPIVGCAGTLDLSNIPLPQLPDCQNLKLGVGQYFATLELDDNQSFPHKTTTVERVAIFALHGTLSAWMPKGTVYIDNETPRLVRGTLEGFVSEDSYEYISGGASGEYLSQSSDIAETSAEGADTYSGLQYVTIKLIENSIARNCQETSPYTATYNILTGEWLIGPIFETPLLAFDARPTFDENTQTFSVGIRGMNVEDLAARFDVCYRFEDMTAYRPVPGNMNSWASGRLGQQLVLDAKKPEIAEAAFYKTLGDNTPLAYCGDSDWWTNQTNLSLKGTVEDVGDYDWESSGVDSLQLVITPDKQGSLPLDPVNLNLDNNNRWVYTTRYDEEHPLLDLKAIDKVGNLGNLRCIPHIDVTPPSLLASNPENGWLLLNLDSKIELILLEPLNSAYLDPGYNYPEHGLENILPNQNINLYDVTDGNCEKINFENDFVYKFRKESHILELRADKDLEQDKLYSLFINDRCGEVGIVAGIHDLAGNVMPRTVIDFSTPRGIGPLSLTKKALDPNTGQELLNIKPDSETVKFEITLANDPDSQVNSSFKGPFDVKDLLPPYFEYVTGSGTYTIVETQGPAQTNIVPITDPLLQAIQGQSLIWQLPDSVNIPAGKELKITYQAQVSASFIPEAYK